MVSDAPISVIDTLLPPLSVTQGFVANRILIPMINEAAYVYYEGLASAEGIDEIMKLGMAHPMVNVALHGRHPAAGVSGRL